MASAISWRRTRSPASASVTIWRSSRVSLDVRAPRTRGTSRERRVDNDPWRARSRGAEPDRRHRPPSRSGDRRVYPWTFALRGLGEHLENGASITTHGERDLVAQNQIAGIGLRHDR